MNCYECALEGRAVPAVATCKHCGAGMCLEHLAAEQSYRVGGTVYVCSHDLSRAASAAPTSVSGNGQVRHIRVR